MRSRNSTLAAFVVAILIAVATQSALARRILPRPWVQNPTHYPGNSATTTVEWEFDQEPQHPVLWQTNYPPDPMHPPMINWPPASLETIPGPNGLPTRTWHIDEDGWIEIFLQNYPEPRPFKDILIQITSDKAPGVPWVSTPLIPGAHIPGAPGDIGGWGGEWYTYTWKWRIEPNPPWEIIRIPVIRSTNIEEIIIDTICYVPEPGMLGVLAMGAVALIRRRS